MLRTLLLCFAVAGLQARPLQNDALRLQNGGWILNSPQLVQDQYLDKPVWEVVRATENEATVQDKTSWTSAPVEERRQGTEPSRRFLMDLNTGMLKEHISEMNRRVSGFYNYPSNYEFRQGTQNSHAILVDTKTGQMLPQSSQMQRNPGPSAESRRGMENSPVSQIDLRSTDDVATDITHEAVPPELRRQGTEPSRRFLMDLNTGMLKEHISEMDRRVSGFYNYPSNYEFRQGTQNSHAILVDTKTGQMLPQSSQMQRNPGPSAESRRGVENSPVSQIDLRSTDDVATDITHEAVPPELRRQGTEPSRRFLMDVNTGMLKEHISEMDRRVSGFYNYPSNHAFRQGTQNSQATLVDIRTGQLHEPISEMQRSAALVSEDRQGSVHSQGSPEELQKHAVESTEVFISSVIEGPSHLKEFRHGEGVATCQGLIVDGKCYHLNRSS
ncbi:uncharacterized protein LOC143484440 isoform X1 [Brachyhypopomus gauderio]|uniref:uncharacterized protein LOC143484440 isoform X1 n=1 Tax=Brachyhypopomus gauderio TaxID=698409 RepID=UPI004041718F